MELHSHEEEESFLDFEQPKKPISSYIFFSADNYAKVQNLYPGLSFGERAKKIGEMWKNTSAEDRRPYEEAAEKSKGMYLKEMVAFLKKRNEDEGSAAAGSAAMIHDIKTEVKEEKCEIMC